MASAVAEEGSEPLMNYKTWVLKVSIHCEGCKRKVNKILKNIDGVYDTIIDSKNHRATVIGNVDGETLVRKLLKAGKHAELLPQKPEKKEKKQEQVKNSEKQKDPQPQTSKIEEQSKPEQSKPEQTAQVKSNNSPSSSEKPAKSNENGAPPAKDNENGGPPAKNSVDGQISESKSDGKKPENLSPEGKPSATTDKKVNESDGVTDKSNSGNSGKKKGKKGQKSQTHHVNVEILHDAPAYTESPTPVNPARDSVNLNRSRQHVNPYESYGQPPAYVMSYSTSHPSSSYSETHYAQPEAYTYAQPPPYSYAQPPPYSYGPPPPQPYTYTNPDAPPLQPSDSFTMFSDEDANGCSIM